MVYRFNPETGRGEPDPPPGHQGEEYSGGGRFERNDDNHGSSGDSFVSR